MRAGEMQLGQGMCEWETPLGNSTVVLFDDLCVHPGTVITFWMLARALLGTMKLSPRVVTAGCVE